MGADEKGRFTPDPPARSRAQQVEDAIEQLKRDDLHPAARAAFERVVEKYGPETADERK